MLWPIRTIYRPRRVASFAFALLFVGALIGVGSACTPPWDPPNISDRGSSSDAERLREIADYATKMSHELVLVEVDGFETEVVQTVCWMKPQEGLVDVRRHSVVAKVIERRTNGFRVGEAVRIEQSLDCGCSTVNIGDGFGAERGGRKWAVLQPFSKQPGRAALRGRFRDKAEDLYTTGLTP